MLHEVFYSNYTPDEHAKSRNIADWCLNVIGHYKFTENASCTVVVIVFLCFHSDLVMHFTLLVVSPLLACIPEVEMEMHV